MSLQHSDIISSIIHSGEARGEASDITPSITCRGEALNVTHHPDIISSIIRRGEALDITPSIICRG